MPRVEVNIPKNELSQAIQAAETEHGIFSNWSALFQHICDTPWGRHGCRDAWNTTRSLSTALIYNRVVQYGLESIIKTPKGRQGKGNNAVRVDIAEHINTMLSGVDEDGDFDYAEVNLQIKDYFSHIYERDPQIQRVLSAIKAAVDSQMMNRYHVLLYGEPACGKSEILTSVGKMLGEEGEAFMKFDGTSLTSAGARKSILNMKKVPPILLIEEIEKNTENALQWLLGVMDHRGELRGGNARNWGQNKNVPMLVIATANNMVKFKSMMSGALVSRFSHKVYCPKPSREIIYKILEREIYKIEGDTAWIEPTLEFCVDNLGWYDPREIIPVCICGRDKLLDNSYQDMILETMDPEDRKISVGELKAMLATC